MALWTGFIGDTYQALSPTIAADTAVNIYAESTGEGKAKQWTFYGTPGLRLITTVAGAGSRGAFTQDGRSWRVIGTTWYAYDAVTQTLSALATVDDDGFPVFFVSNGEGGRQVGCQSGGNIYVLDLDTNVVTAAVLPFSGPVTLAFLDGYTLANQAASPIVWFSAVEDMLTWDALDFFTRSGTSDNLVAIATIRDRLRCWGSKTTTDFYDSGDADTPFVPYPSTTTQSGLLSPYLLSGYNDQFYFVAETSKGQRRFISSGGAETQTLSTPPIELFFAACTTLDDATILAYEQDGHLFIAVTAPSSSDDIKTVVYDATEQQWQKRAGWDSVNGLWTRWIATAATSVNGQTLVGDYANGNVYELDLETYTDNGAILRRERTAPYVSAENQWLFVDQIELGMQAGVGLSIGQGSDPLVNLEISRDAAQTWVNAGTASLGAMAAYGARAIWRHLGRARADRFVARVSMTDPVKCVLGPGLWLRVTTGRGEL